MEHFELHEKLQSTMPLLLINLNHMGLSSRGLETLGSILSNHFIDLLEQCNHEGRQKDYKNRQPRAHPSPNARLRPKQSSLRRRLGAAHRDSGVDVSSVDNSNGPEYLGGSSRRRSIDVSSSVQTTPLLYQENPSCLLEDIPEFMLGGSSWGPPHTGIAEATFLDASFGPAAHAGRDASNLFPNDMSQEAMTRDLLGQGGVPEPPTQRHNLPVDVFSMNNYTWGAPNGDVSEEHALATRSWKGS